MVVSVSPCSEQYMLRKKRTEEEDKLLNLLQGMKPQDGFTTWCEQMLHALNTSANNSSSSLDGNELTAFLHPWITDLHTYTNISLVARLQHLAILFPPGVKCKCLLSSSEQWQPSWPT